jgi:cytochrome P450
MVILPHWAINEIKSLPEHKASLNKELYIRFLGKYTLLGQEDEEMVSVIKHDLVRGLPEIFNDVLTDETMFGLRSTFGTSSEWTSFPVFEKVARVITMINGRTFVGLPLSREEEWINSTISFTTEGDIVAQSLRPYPALIRPFVAPFLSTVRSLLKHQALVSKKTQPYIDDYLKTLSHNTNGKSKNTGEKATKGRLMDWLLKKYNRRVGAARIAKDYLLSSAASIPIPASLLTHILFELASRPEYVEPLRAELAKVMKERGKWSYSCLGGLDKMDSFIKECQRLNSHGLSMFPFHQLLSSLSNYASLLIKVK